MRLGCISTLLYDFSEEFLFFRNGSIKQETKTEGICLFKDRQTKWMSTNSTVLFTKTTWFYFSVHLLLFANISLDSLA